jgi:hypothetical protein
MNKRSSPVRQRIAGEKILKRWVKESILVESREGRILSLEGRPTQDEQRGKKSSKKESYTSEKITSALVKYCSNHKCTTEYPSSKLCRLNPTYCTNRESGLQKILDSTPKEVQEILREERYL